MQTSFSNSLTAAEEGRIGKERLSAEIASPLVDDSNNIKPGRIVGQSGANDCRLPYSNTITLLFSADLVASNTIDGDLVINGSSTSISQVTYSSDHATSMGLIKTELEGISGVSSVTLGADSSENANRLLTVTLDHQSDGYAENWTVAAGASQATVTEANDVAEPFYGITHLEALEPDSSGVISYKDNFPASVVRKGYVWVRSDDALTKGADVYVRYYDESSSATDKTRGMLMASDGASGGITRAKLWSGAYVEIGCAAGGLALIGVNKP